MMVSQVNVGCQSLSTSAKLYHIHITAKV